MRFLRLVAASLLFLTSQVFAADNYTIETSAGGQTTIRATDTGTTKIPHYMLSAGNPAVTGSSGNVANANAVATLTAGTQRAHITGFQCTAAGATAAAVKTVTVAGVITGTMSYTFIFPAGATVQSTPLIVSFPIPVPASAAAVDIVVTLPAAGAGNTNATCSAQGYLN